MLSTKNDQVLQQVAFSFFSSRTHNNSLFLHIAFDQLPHNSSTEIPQFHHDVAPREQTGRQSGQYL